MFYLLGCFIVFSHFVVMVLGWGQGFIYFVVLENMFFGVNFCGFMDKKTAIKCSHALGKQHYNQHNRPIEIA